MSGRASRDRAVLLLVVCSWTTRAYADDDVTVRGSQSAGFSGQANVESAPREVTDAASLIEPLPGVHVRRLGGDDSFATLSIRGSSANQVAVVLAGVPLTDAADPTLDLGSLPLWPDASVRVYRSFTPATVGAGSLGGTLVLDPPKAFGASKTETWGAVGSFGSARLRVSDTEKLDWNGQDAYVVTGLSASRAADDFTYFDPRSGHDVARVNADHAAVNGLVTVVLPVGWSSASRGSLKITTIAQARKQGIPGSVDFPTPDARSESSRLLEALELGGTLAGGAWHVRGWGRRESVVSRSSALDLIDPIHNASSVVAAGTGAGWRGRFAERFALATTVDASAERYLPGQTFGGPLVFGATRTLADAGADVDVRIARAWTASASGRVDLWHDASAEPKAVTGTEARPTAHVGSEIAAGPVTLAAHGGAVARAPSFIERYGNHGLVLGAPDLRTETAWVADAGARTSFKHDSFRGRVEVAGFASWADALIAFVPLGAYRALQATNIGRARIMGVEAEAAVFLADLGLRVSYTYIASADETECVSDESGSCTRPPLPGRPAHDLVTDLSYRVGPLLLRYGVDVVSGLFVGRLGDVPVPARALQSAGARFDVPHAPGLRLALDIRNLFDLRTGYYDGVSGPISKPIGDSYDYPIPGRSLLFSVRYVSER